MDGIEAAPHLLCSVSGGVARLTLNRPKAFNSLSLTLLKDLEERLALLDGDPAIRAIVIAGEGKAFCAGHDLKEMGSDLRYEPVKALFAQCSRVMTLITRMNLPVIAEIDGIATAAGCQLVAACDLAICTHESRFATSGVKFGLFCSTPMVALSRNIPRKNAMEMLLTGDFIDAAEAARIGLVNQSVAGDELETAVADLAARLIDKPRAVLALGKKAFYRQLELELEEAYAFTTEVIVENALGRDFEEGLDAFKAKRKPVWPAAASASGRSGKSP